MNLKVIITGATGMVGEGVLHECLQHPDVSQVLVVGRKPSGKSHAKLTEIVHRDFQDLSPVADQFTGYDACFFCLGVTSIGLKEPAYHKLTYDLTLHFAAAMIIHNPNSVFIYVSGAGTDSTEAGKTMWARVKGKTENALMRLPFKKTYMFRPGYMQPTNGLTNSLKAYKFLGWTYPLLRKMFPNSVSTLKEVGLAMINAVIQLPPKSILEVKDIVALASSVTH